jgi:oligoendopeptidase F
MEKKYKVKIITRSHWFVQFITLVLDNGVNEWLDRWSISMKRYVYLNFTPGGPKGTAIEQLLTIAHEFGHIRRQKYFTPSKKTRRKWTTNYVTSTAFRTNEEVAAHKVEMEVAHMFNRTITPSECVAKLDNYAVKNKDLKVAKKHLDRYDRFVQSGRIAQRVSKVTKEWWGR